MSGGSTHLDAEAMRRAFDSSFAQPVAPAAEAPIDLIGIGMGGLYYAMRMSQITGLRSDLHVTPCPSPVAELMGIAGVGGALTPVYDLAALLGLPSGSRRWTALVEGGALALAFTDFLGHFRLERSAIVPRTGNSTAVHVTDFASHADRSWSVVDIPSVVSAIRKGLPLPQSMETS
jgi:purine-binding chemotaxis protein CheW